MLIFYLMGQTLYTVQLPIINGKPYGILEICITNILNDSIQ